MSLIAELKRRNVFKVGLAYLALGWVAVQLTSIIAPAMHLPDWTILLVLWIGVIGFPFVVVFSWAYELTPEGLKRESEVDRSQSITHVTGKRLDTLIIAMVAVAMLMFAADRFIPRAALPQADASSAPVPHAQDDAGSSVGAGPARDSSLDVSQTPGRGQGPLLQEEAPDANSIAVLPFVDMSQAKDQEYFSDGIAEELLNLLAKIPELKVAARTSSFSYKGSNTRIAQIGQELNVAHVLEGSVRKAGNTVRITAQLVRAADGYHLWSETFDRPLDDIFAVQDEIAAAVVEQLKIKLLGAAPTVRRVNPEAYALYLRAVQQDRLYTNAGMEQSFKLYQQALEIEPAYAAAWLGVAGHHFDQAFLGRGPLSADENFRLAREAAGKALAIDPAFAPAHAFLGMIANLYDNDPAAAARQIEHALVLDPSHPSVLTYVIRQLVTLGRVADAIELAEQQVELDPIYGGSHAFVGWLYARVGRLDEALATYRTALLLNPDGVEDNYQLGVTLLHRGEKEAALEAILAEPDEGWRLTGLAVVYHALGRKAESDAALAELIEKHEQVWSDAIAWVMAYRGDADAAFEWMDKAVARRNTGVVHFPVELLLASLHDDARWLPFLRRIGRAPEQLAAIEFDVKLPHK